MRVFWWLLTCLLSSLLLLGYPIYVIRPFRRQGPRELALALAVIRFRPAIGIALAVLAIWLLFRLWRANPGTRMRVAAGVCTSLTICFALLSRVNLFEQMFHPLDKPSFSPAFTSNLDGAEQVIAVRIGTAARAYPIRSMSYHHIVNDRLAGLPIVATY